MPEEALQKLRNGMGTSCHSNVLETGALYGTSEFFRATCGNDLTAMNFDFPPTMEGVCSHESQVTVNDSFSHVKSQPQTIGSIGRPDCGLEIIYFNARSILPKLDELQLLCAESSPHVECIVEPGDNELTIFPIIRESVDSLCRDGADAQYMQYLSKSPITSTQIR